MQFLMTPRRFVWTWTLAVLGLLFTLALLSCGGPVQRTSTPADTRDPETVFTSQEEMALAVRLDVACKMPNDELVTYIGSGVVVGRTRVLTAWHVVDCVDENRNVTGKLLSIDATSSDGVHRALSVEIALLPADVARLKLVKDAARFVFTRRHHVARPPYPFGDVCIATLYPKIEHKCGSMRPMRREPPGDIEHGAITIPGNSGSGIYDEHGRLVAIVTHYTSALGIPLGGRATSLYPRRFLVPRWELFP